MVIDSKGNVFEERRNADRRKEKKESKNTVDNRKNKDRRDQKNAYKA